ncbi:MAG: site-specific DNA-methyltransferase [Polyangiaceae bacterium]
MVKERERVVRLSWGGKERALAPHHAGARSGAPTHETRAGLVLPGHVVPHVAHGSSRGVVLKGDNAALLGDLRATMRESVTLAYMDPPFLTGRVHKAVKRARSEGGIERELSVAFDDRWEDRAAYLESLGTRLVHIRDLLAPHGSVVVHVDPKTSHYVKVLCDEIFGDECFASEIVWRYRRWPSKTPNFQRVHDVLLRYRKDPDVTPRWTPLYEPLAPSTLATWGTKKQRAVVGDKGRRLRSSTTEEASQGVPMGDVWDIGVIAPVARERTGYPSQKPEALLERLVSALSAPGDVVLDPYAGSGTTLAVASRLGRRYVGLDASDVAIATTTGRLTALEGAAVPEPPASRPRSKGGVDLEEGSGRAYPRAVRQ